MAGLTEVCVAEFVGTFLLIFTVGCNVLAGNPVWGGVSIACSLMVGIYALGGASGANFNPAVSLALGLAGKMGKDEPFQGQPWKQVGVYVCVQIAAGLVAALCYGALYGEVFNLGPTDTYAWWQAMLCELLYTFMLCFVVLNVAASKAVGGGKNQFFGFAIGFVIVAGAYGPGAVSGGCFNPAVAFAIDSSSIHKGFGWCLVYTIFELLGAAAAVGAFKLVRPEEQDEAAPAPEKYTDLKTLLVAEGIGTFMLVLTVGLNVLVESKAAAFSIAAALMCMIMAIGDISGGHFNPAVTVAILVRSGKFDADALKQAGAYIATQLVAGLAGALTYALIHGGITFPIGPGEGFTWGHVMAAEIVFTFVLCFVVLCVATVKKNPAVELTGFIIGSCVTVGGLAIGKISGGSLNPAVSFGIATARVLFGGTFYKGVIYMVFEVIGGLLAAGVFAADDPNKFISPLIVAHEGPSRVLLASVDNPASAEFARGFHVPPIQVVAHTSLHSTNLNPRCPDAVRVAGGVVVLLHSPPRDLAVGGRPPVQPLPLLGQTGRPDKLVKADSSTSPVPDLQQRHVVPPVPARRGQRPELLVLQDDVHLKCLFTGVRLQDEVVPDANEPVAIIPLLVEAVSR